jgi:hypothetical protein
MDNFLEFIYSNTKPGMFALVNYFDRRVAIFFSRNPAKKMVELTTEFRNGTATHKQLETDFHLGRLTIETLDIEAEHKSYWMWYWKDHYESFNYSLYFPLVIPKMDIRMEYVLHEMQDKALIHVTVRIDGKTNVVGVFDNYWTARDFINVNYSANPGKFIYAENPLTQQYYEDKSPV